MRVIEVCIWILRIEYFPTEYDFMDISLNNLEEYFKIVSYASLIFTRKLNFE